jgi:hypothetical protein
MSILTTFNGVNIIGLPCDTIAGVTAPSSIQWDPQEAVAVSVSGFTGQTQSYDWQASWWEGQISFPQMSRYDADAWSAFILQCRGQSNAFMFGDPKAVLPKGSALGSPVVNGGSQFGYSLNTRGWQANAISILLPGDYIQIGYRLYKVLNPVNTDGSGNATLAIWPNLRDMPVDGTTIQIKNCKGLFSLKTNSGNKFSVNVGLYGLTGIAIRERL